MSNRHSGASECLLLYLLLLFPLVPTVCLLVFSTPCFAQEALKNSYEHAQQLFEQGKTADARAAFRSLLVQTYQDRAALYQQEGSWRLAGADLQAVLSVDAGADKVRYDLAYTEFRTQHYREAVSQLKELLTKSPGTPQVHALLGKAYLSLGRLELARRELQAAMRLNPKDHLTAYTLALADLTDHDRKAADLIVSQLEKSLGSSPRFHLVIARAYSDTGYQQVARQELAQALAMNPKTRYAHYLMAIVLLREKGSSALEKAKVELAEETRQFPDEFEAHYLLGVLMVFQHHWNDAGHVLHKAVLVEPNQPETYYYLGEVYFGQRQLRKAADALRKGLALAKSRGDTRFPVSRAHFLLSRVYRALGETQAGMKQAREAGDSFRAGSSKISPAGGVEARLRESLAGLASPSSTVTWKDPSPAVPLTARQKHLLGIYGEVLVSAHNYLARIAVGKANFKEAADQFAAVRKLQPEYPEIDFRLGLALFKGQEFSQAVKPLKDAIARNPADPLATKYLGLTYFELGQYDNAVKQLERVHELSPNDPEVLLALGGSLARTHRVKQAQQVMAELLKSDPNSAGLHILLGKAYAAQGQSPQAEQEFRRALEINPQTPSAHLYLGILKMQDGKMAEAGKEFKAELHFHPDSLEARYDLAFALLKQEKTAEAIPILRRVIQEKPLYSEAHYSLGKALLQQGKKQEAIRELKTAVQLDPKKAYAHYQLGRAYMMVGQRAEARQQFELTRTLKDKELKFKIPQVKNTP